MVDPPVSFVVTSGSDDDSQGALSPAADVRISGFPHDLASARSTSNTVSNGLGCVQWSR